MRLSTQNVAPVSELEEIHLQPGHIFFKSVNRDDWDELLLFPGVQSLRTGRMLERLIKGLKGTEVLKFVPNYFPMS